MDFLKGWKTTLGAVGTLLGGVAMVIRALTAEQVDVDMLMGGITVIAGALAVFGIGKKIERNGGKSS